MNTSKKLIIFFIFVIIIGMGFANFMPKEENVENTRKGLRIGSGDDITGLLLEQILKTSKDININIEDKEDVYFDFTFKDC